jgi:HTH-type transcriptional regulator/antitoxin HigA
MVTKTESYPDVAVPPGEYLAEEIEARGMTQKELARRMGRPLNAINEIIKGKKAITAETALQLETVMSEIPARFWLNLETDYQLTRAIINKRAKA